MHVDQSDQDPTQGMGGQTGAVQETEGAVDGQDRPPAMAGEVSANVQDWVPLVLQAVAEQRDRLEEQTASTGQAGAVQETDGAVEGQDRPPATAGEVSTNVQDWVPLVPQSVEEQGDRLEEQPASTGQAGAVQETDGAVEGQDRPPATAGDDSANVQDWVPLVPQSVTEQEDRLEEQPASTEGQSRDPV